MQTNQTPESLAEEILRAASDFAAAKLALYGRQDPSLGNPADLLDDLKFAINRLRDMAASGSKREPLTERVINAAIAWETGSITSPLPGACIELRDAVIAYRNAHDITGEQR